jgi:hypothetical protein
VSPNRLFPLDESPQNPITQRILEHPRVTFHVDGDALVVAIKDELLVRASARNDRLDKALNEVASLSGSLGGSLNRESQDAESQIELPDDVEVWRLTDPKADSIDEARRLRRLAPELRVDTHKGPELVVPSVSPNHVSVVCKYNSCPAGPPNPIPPPHDGDRFIELSGDGGRAKVVVIDTGYMETSPPHATLDARVHAVAGRRASMPPGRDHGGRPAPLGDGAQPTPEPGG